MQQALRGLGSSWGLSEGPILAMPVTPQSCWLLRSRRGGRDCRKCAAAASAFPTAVNRQVPTGTEDTEAESFGRPPPQSLNTSSARCFQTLCNTTAKRVCSQRVGGNSLPLLPADFFSSFWIHNGLMTHPRAFHVLLKASPPLATGI